MFANLLRATLIAGAAVGLAACAEDYGYGGGVGYAGGYGYEAGPYDGYYGNPYGYSSVPFGYAGAGFGWYGDYYYPGTGYYVYDRGGHRRQWDRGQQTYWSGRAHERHDFRAQRNVDRAALASGQVTRPAYRADRRQDRSAYQAYRAERGAGAGPNAGSNGGQRGDGGQHSDGQRGGHGRRGPG